MTRPICARAPARRTPSASISARVCSADSVAERLDGVTFTALPPGPSHGHDDDATTMTKNPAHIAEQLAGRPVPASSRHPEGRADVETCRDFGLRIARDGEWFYHGSPIGRKSLIRLFSSALRRDGDGAYWLITPAERGRIEVEDAPFTAVELNVTGQGKMRTLTFRTNVDDEVAVDEDHPIRVAIVGARGEPRPYVTVRDGLEARILRAVFYQLVDLAEVRETGGARAFGVWSKGAFFALGDADTFEAAGTW
ncbi:MAG: DUF1285 domain-containing protein [Alphaproteobacteria bacterium]